MNIRESKLSQTKEDLCTDSQHEWYMLVHHKLMHDDIIELHYGGTTFPRNSRKGKFHAHVVYLVLEFG